MSQQRAGQPPREAPPWERERAGPVADRHQRRREECRGRCAEHHRRHRGAFESLDQVGRRLADGEGADHRADGEAAAAAEPGGHHLHRRRVDAGEAARRSRSASPRRRRSRGASSSAALAAAAAQGRGGEQRPRRDEVGEVEQGSDRRAGHEAELHRAGEPAGGRRLEPPAQSQRLGNGAGGEPDRHAEELGEGYEQQAGDRPRDFAEARGERGGGRHARKAMAWRLRRELAARGRQRGGRRDAGRGASPAHVAQHRLRLALAVQAGLGEHLGGLPLPR